MFEYGIVIRQLPYQDNKVLNEAENLRFNFEVVAFNQNLIAAFVELEYQLATQFFLHLSHHQFVFSDCLHQKIYLLTKQLTLKLELFRVKAVLLRLCVLAEIITDLRLRVLEKADLKQQRKGLRQTL